jgi:hypothetical protein
VPEVGAAMNMGHWILYGPDHQLEPCGLFEWARWIKKNERHVANETIDGVHISTVFLGIDHNFSENGPPLLFETMIFGGQEDQFQRRYATWAEAEAGHKEAVELVKSNPLSWIPLLQDGWQAKKGG